VDPNVDPSIIRMKYEGQKSLTIDSSGELNISTGLRSLKESKPVCYQIIQNRTISINANYAISNNNEVYYTIENYDPSYPLIIDPYLKYSTLTGLGGDDANMGITHDMSGNIYVTGSTTSPPPSSQISGLIRTSNAGSEDLVVTKLNPSLSNLLYCSFFGGSKFDQGMDIVVDSAGNAYVAGGTNSTNFPITSGTFQTTNGGNFDAFLIKLNPSGNTLLFSTYLGKGGNDFAGGVDVDPAGNVYMTGDTNSTGFPTTAQAYKKSKTGFLEAFVSKFSPTGTNLIYSTYLGEIVWDLRSTRIKVDSNGNAFVVGKTGSQNYPTTNGAYQQTHGGAVDAFVTKVNPAGSGLIYSTFLGKLGGDFGNGIDIDSSGNAYIVGATNSKFFPTSSTAFQKVKGGNMDAFITKLDPTGSNLVYSTYLGGTEDDIGWDICVDSQYKVIITGNTLSSDFKITPDAFQKVNMGNNDAFVSKLNPTGSILEYSTYIGNTGRESSFSITIDSADAASITGFTGSVYYPTTQGAFQTLYGGGKGDAFISKFSFIPVIPIKSNIGVFRGKTWSVDYNGNGYWNSGDKTANFGVGDGKDIPVTGDWNGNGKTKIGVVRGKTWSVDYNGNGYWDSSDKTATFGVGDGKDKPVTGDWNGNGKTKIGAVRGKTWYVDYNGNGYWDSSDKTATFGVGDGQDKPVTGDWNGNGKTNIGVVRGNKWYVDYNGNGYWDSGDKTATFGGGDGKDIPVTGDWSGNGKTNIGVVRGNKWYVDFNGNGYWDPSDKTATFGVGDGKDIPVVGKWSGTGVASVEANQVQEPERLIQPPMVTRPESDIPRVEMPVKSSPVISPMSGGGVVLPQNPLVNGGGVQLPGRTV
jgi:hypothetical protein